MTKITYSSNGIAVGDSNSEKFVLDNIGKEIEVSSDLVVLAARCLVKEGKINHKEIIFIYNREVIHCDKYGNLASWPRGFCDMHEDLLLRII